MHCKELKWSPNVPNSNFSTKRLWMTFPIMDSLCYNPFTKQNIKASKANMFRNRYSSAETFITPTLFIIKKNSATTTNFIYGDYLYSGLTSLVRLLWAPLMAPSEKSFQVILFLFLSANKHIHQTDTKCLTLAGWKYQFVCFLNKVCVTKFIISIEKT